MSASDMNPARDAGGVNTGGTVLFPIQFTWPNGGRSVFLSGSFNRWTELVLMSQVEGSPNVFQVVCAVPHGCHEHRISAVTLNQAMPRILEEDVQASRHQISVFLAAHTAYELLPESGKVVALDVDLPVKQAFHILAEQGIPMAPLWDFYKGKFVGVISASDFILILRELGDHGSNLTEEELETHTISAWKEGKAYMNGQVDGHGRPIPRHLISAGPHDNLKDVALKILQNGVAIIPVIHSSSEDGSFPQLLHLASLSGILKCMCKYFKHCPGSLPILQLPIYAIRLGTWVPRIGESSSRPFAMLRPTTSLISALNLLVQAQVSSIPIVDDNDSLLDIYCRSDITALAKGRAYTHNLNEMTVYQVLDALLLWRLAVTVWKALSHLLTFSGSCLVSLKKLQITYLAVVFAMAFKLPCLVGTIPCPIVPKGLQYLTPVIESHSTIGLASCFVACFFRILGQRMGHVT